MHALHLPLSLSKLTRVALTTRVRPRRALVRRRAGPGRAAGAPPQTGGSGAAAAARRRVVAWRARAEARAADAAMGLLLCVRESGRGRAVSVRGAGLGARGSARIFSFFDSNGGAAGRAESGKERRLAGPGTARSAPPGHRTARVIRWLSRASEAGQGRGPARPGRGHEGDRARTPHSRTAGRRRPSARARQRGVWGRRPPGQLSPRSPGHVCVCVCVSLSPVAHAGRAGTTHRTAAAAACTGRAMARGRAAALLGAARPRRAASAAIVGGIVEGPSRGGEPTTQGALCGCCVRVCVRWSAENRGVQFFSTHPLSRWLVPFCTRPPLPTRTPPRPPPLTPPPPPPPPPPPRPPPSLQA